ncbi:MAG: prolyl oligopeptidase family serine peptidase [Gemmatimonadales bacterium]|nr:prolyl oligopeptidase family serine peptidase [Gemmatimonadales bacterium]
MSIRSRIARAGARAAALATVRAAALALALPLTIAAQQTTGGFTLAQVMSAPYPTNLTAAATGERLAWTLNERGLRNVWVAEGPAFAARRLTDYTLDDGQELNDVSISADGKWVVYMRGGDFGSNWDDALPVNPLGMPTPTRVEIWTVPFAGGTPVSLGEGESPVISPRSDMIVFQRAGALWQSPIDGSAPAKRLFTLRGSASDARFSPDGSRIAFVSSRGDHAFIGIYTNATTPILWVAPSTSRDWSPRWSPDGTRLVFARRSGAGGPPNPSLEPVPAPWSLMVADARTGEAKLRWSSEVSLKGSVPSTHGGVNLHWAAGDRIAFLSYHDGWPHLYSMTAAGSDAPTLLTPGDHMAEYIRLSHDGRHLLYAGNAGSTPGDIDRRHIVRVAVDRAGIEVLTPGTGLEWTPVSMGSGRIAAIGATAQRAPVPMVLDGATPRWIGAERVPAEFPAAQLVTPRQVTYRASDGVLVHAQLFEPPAGGPARKPAVVYVHGGPPRQMLLGWHYSDYYWNAYAMNQYLASRGFVVLSINYRLGIGYGFDFHRPPRAGIAGASEYLDVKAAGDYLRTLGSVDPARIGIYGGSYGGYLTALALGRNSDIFAAGVDIHGVHDFTSEGGSRFGGSSWRYERPAAELQWLADLAWQSSPVSAVKTWRSPVLLIHGDDDRNVRFSQTVDLIQRLKAHGVEYEEITIVDDTHHFMRHENQKRVNAAIAEYLERKLRPGR